MPNISTMHNFLFWLQQDLHSIYQFWKQPTSMPYSLFSVVKRNSFIHSKFNVNFFFTFLTKPKQYFSSNQIARMTKLSLTNQRTRRYFLYFLYFCINFIQFEVIFAASYVIIATHYHFNVVNLYIYHCILVFLHSSVDS